MSVVTRALVGGVALALVAAPAAFAAPKAAKLSVRSASGAPASIEAGKSFTVTARIANARGRKAAAGRLTLSLRTSSAARSLGSKRVSRVRGGSTRTVRLRVTVGKGVRARTYTLRACVRRTGASASKCRNVRRIRVTAVPAPVPTPAPTPAPQPAPAPTATPDTRTTAEKLRDEVTADGMKTHLDALQDVADNNGGNRASGLQGYGGTTQYLVTTLRAAGYEPRVEPFAFLLFTQLAPSAFEITAPDPREFTEDEDFAIMEYSGTGNVTAPLQAVDINLDGDRANSSGCEAADFAGFTEGNIALMQRGTCAFGDKAANAEAAGASGAIVFNQGDTPADDRSGLFFGTLGVPVGIPAISLSFADGQTLATTAGATGHIATSTQTDERVTANILAETPGGDPENVVLVGSHLDSVAEGPGINDNGSGSAFNLELALKVAELGIEPKNKLRFAWWGAEESGLIGSTEYVLSISDEEFFGIQMNLNFDMLASPNHATFVYDGDFSDSDPPASAPDVNPGAVEIEEAFNAYFDSVGRAYEPTAFDGRSDYKAFQDFGVAAGGLFSGAEVPKTAEQVTKWGGLPDIAFDPNYHGEGDDIDNLDLEGFEALADAGAYVAGTYAEQTLESRTAAPAKGARAAAARTAALSDWLGSRVQR